MTVKSIALAAVLGTAMASGANAAIIGVAGQGEVLSPIPTVIDNGTPTDNDSLKAFDEIQDLLLTSTLVTDDGTANAGDTVSSHMIFINKVAGTPGTIGPYTATFTFANQVLGVFANNTGLTATHDQLGAVGTDYSGLVALGSAGLENNDDYSISGNSITVTMRSSQPGDWLRVVTVDVAAVPVPAGAVLLPGALFALGAMRRRKTAKA